MEWPEQDAPVVPLGIGRTPRRAMATFLSPKKIPNCHRSHCVASARRDCRRLLVDLINTSDSQGYQALSLNVREANPPRRLYESVGFVPVETHGSSWTMVRYAVDHSDPLPGGQGHPCALLIHRRETGSRSGSR